MSARWRDRECLHINCQNQWTDYDEACCCVVGYGTVLWSGSWVPTFRRYILPPSSQSLENLGVQYVLSKRRYVLCSVV